MNEHSLNKVNTIETRIIKRKVSLDCESPLTSIDFIVDGQSLFEILQAEKHDLVGAFSPRWGDIKEIAQVFLKKGKSYPYLEGRHFDRRVLMYCCAECGDIGCGGITAKIVQEDGFMKWFHFAYESGSRRRRYQKVGPFYFKPDDYLKTIKTAVSKWYALKYQKD